jgi:CelD/BcsL family acetyltransferase involved in cellulose biosynthesis
VSDGLSICAVRERDALASLTSDWWELWRSAPQATPFQSPAWLLPWWDCFCPGELFVGAARRNGRLAALALFYFETGASGRRLLPIGISLSDYHDVLVAPDEPDALRALAEHMSAADPSWDEWELAELSPRASALILPCPADCEETADADIPCPVLTLPSDLAGLRATLPCRRWRALCGARNRAARRGAVEVADGRKDPGWFLGELIRLHQSRWESDGEAGVFADPRVRSFHAKALPQLCTAGLARLFVLRIAGRVSAAYYGLMHRDRAYSYLTGFDRAQAFESPGSILLGHAIEQAIGEGARELHFLRGGEAYKYEWGAVERRNTRRTFRRRKP